GPAACRRTSGLVQLTEANAAIGLAGVVDALGVGLGVGVAEAASSAAGSGRCRVAVGVGVRLGVEVAVGVGVVVGAVAGAPAASWSTCRKRNAAVVPTRLTTSSRPLPG